MSPPPRAHYRLARPADALAIGKLARRVTRRWILPELPSSAAPWLLAGMGARVIRGKIAAGQRFHLACQEDGRVVGVAAMRDDSHLFQFFVSTRMQRRGIARQLWRRIMRDAIRRAGTRHFTLNSSVMAIPVYRRLGFVSNGPLQISAGGLITQPMQLDPG
ncbi:MAG TPA: GNAT family N-acetyltransferase [Rhodanobacter sp.]|nr:GNAT family N-acetyltransferase [Rhodanobacter sp.]